MRASLLLPLGLAAALSATSGRAYLIRAQLGTFGGGTNSTSAPRLAAENNVDFAGGYFYRSSTTDGADGSLRISASRFSKSPSEDVSTFNGTCASSSIEEDIKVNGNLTGLTEVVMVARLDIGAFHAFNGRTTEDGIIGPPANPNGASAGITAILAIGAGDDADVTVTVKKNGAGGVTVTSNEGATLATTSGGEGGISIRYPIPVESLDRQLRRLYVRASISGESRNGHSNYYMELAGTASVWVGLEGTQGWAPLTASPFLSQGGGRLGAQQLLGENKIQVLGRPGQVFRLLESSSLGPAWDVLNPAIVIPTNGSAQVTLPALTNSHRFFKLERDP